MARQQKETASRRTAVNKVEKKEIKLGDSITSSPITMVLEIKNQDEETPEEPEGEKEEKEEDDEDEDDEEAE